MKKNEALPGGPWVTPTTKEEAHDVPISGVEVVSMGLMDAADWEATAARALAVFRFGQAEAAKRGLILVDTKYEFGRDPATGDILLIDEVHTPDSSRYWLADSYEARFAAGAEPDNIDKEFLRLWFKANCDPYGAAPLPEAPADLVKELSSRYVRLFEMITGGVFAPGAGAEALPAAVAPFAPPARALALLLRTGGEGRAEEEAREAGAALVAAGLAVELHAGEGAAAVAALAEGAAAAKWAAALVLPGGGAAAAAGALAGAGVPTICVRSDGADDGGGGGGAGAAAAPLVSAPTVASALAFLRAGYL